MANMYFSPFQTDRLDLILILVLLLIWNLTWKAAALWVAARRGEKIWFLILVVVNTFAILEIIYLAFVADVFNIHGGKKKK